MTAPPAPDSSWAAASRARAGLSTPRPADPASLQQSIDDVGDMIAQLSERVDQLVMTPNAPRHYADGIKLAIQELAESEPETLRRFIMACWDHMADGASKAAGKKLFTMVGAAMLAAALWMVARKW
jgi:hypothetical protein